MSSGRPEARVAPAAPEGSPGAEPGAWVGQGRRPPAASWQTGLGGSSPGPVLCLCCSREHPARSSVIPDSRDPEPDSRAGSSRVYYLLVMKRVFVALFYIKQGRKPIVTHAGLWSQGRWEGAAGCALHRACSSFYCTSSNSPRFWGWGSVRSGAAHGHCPALNVFRPGLSELSFPVHVGGCVSADAALRPHVCFKQMLLFPVSCQIILFGIQGSRRTRLKLELIEQNTAFPGNARAAHSQAPTAWVPGRPGVIPV